MHPVVFHLLTLLPATLVLALFAIWKVRRRAVDTNQPPAAVRTANLNTGAENDKSWWFGLLPTLLLTGATASLLELRWRTLPERFPVHWGINGEPDGWANRSFGSVFGLLILSFLLTLGFRLLGDLIARSSPGHQGRPAMIGTTRSILLACSWFVTILLCLVSLLPLAHDPSNLVPLLLTGSLIFSLGLVAYAAYRSTRISQTIAAGQNSTERRFWKAGWIYYNPGDSALMVPKREGFGYTFNFGRPVSWLIFAAILLIPLLLLFLIHGSHNK